MSAAKAHLTLALDGKDLEKNIQAKYRVRMETEVLTLNSRLQALESEELEKGSIIRKLRAECAALRARLDIDGDADEDHLSSAIEATATEHEVSQQSQGPFVVHGDVHFMKEGAYSFDCQDPFAKQAASYDDAGRKESSSLDSSINAAESALVAGLMQQNAELFQAVERLVSNQEALEQSIREKEVELSARDAALKQFTYDLNQLMAENVSLKDKILELSQRDLSKNDAIVLLEKELAAIKLKSDVEGLQEAPICELYDKEAKKGEFERVIAENNSLKSRLSELTQREISLTENVCLLEKALSAASVSAVLDETPFYAFYEEETSVASVQQQSFSLNETIADMSTLLDQGIFDKNASKSLDDSVGMLDFDIDIENKLELELKALQQKIKDLEEVVSLQNIEMFSLIENTSKSVRAVFDDSSLTNRESSKKLNWIYSNLSARTSRSPNSPTSSAKGGRGGGMQITAGASRSGRGGGRGVVSR